jgi:DNA-binding NtrC family response regulator
MRSIIVVDDDAAVRRVAARILVEEGFFVLEAEDGDEAMRIAEANREVGLVVSDIVMPRVNGIELLERLARTRPTLPVVLMSGYSSQELMGRALVAPCGILKKPFAPEELLDEVRRCLATAA